jgi:hypothetical protein
MKNILLLLFLTVSFFACKPEPEEKQPNQHIYFYLTKEQLAKTPYFTNPAFDTLSFVSNLNDTLTFVKTKTDSGFYEENYKDHPSGPTNYLYSQFIHNTYKTIKGEGSFWVRHSMKTFSGFNTINMAFNNYSFSIGDWQIGSTTYVGYVGDFERDNVTYKNVLNLGNNGGLGYLNQNLGLFYIDDKPNQKTYILIK